MGTIGKLVKRSFATMGLELSKLPRIRRFAGSENYGLVRPFATYSPWKKDVRFLEVQSLVTGFTLVDTYRCFELWKLVEQVAKLDEGDFLEVGVWRGGTGALVAQKAIDCGIQGRVFLCDTFRGVVKTSEKDSAYTGGEHADTSRKLVEDFLMGRMKLNNVEILEGIFPDQTSDRVSHRRFRLCHVDVDVYQSAKDVVDWVWGRMVPGGVIVFDDYGFDTCDGIARLVEEQMPLEDRIVLHNLNGHAIMIKSR